MTVERAMKRFELQKTDRITKAGVEELIMVIERGMKYTVSKVEMQKFRKDIEALEVLLTVAE